MRFILDRIDRITMYRLVLYYLAVLLVVGAFFGAIGTLALSPVSILWSALVLIAATWIVNELFAWIFGVDTNHESFLITALILALILPPAAFSNLSATGDLAVVGAIAVASKYLLSAGKKHIFNPAALAAVFAAFFLAPPTWWVGGNLALLPFVLLGGLAIAYKIRRFDTVIAFFVAALATVALTSGVVLSGIQTTLLYSPLFFLAFAMLTEPLTMPPTRGLRIIYAGIVGILFAPAVHLWSFYSSPELGLVIGNAFAYVVSPKGRYSLVLVARRKLADGIYEFVFRPDRPIRFRPGQYLEWTLGHGIPFDSRGNRRYFTISSAPEDPNIALGVRFYPDTSGFKRGLANLKAGDSIMVGSLAGDFTLPKDTGKKLAFIAGGIGVTPFASMARHMNASGEVRDAVLLYSSRRAADFAYGADLAKAAEHGLRTVYTLTDDVALQGARQGAITAAVIAEEIPDYHERTFYVSGPPGMVRSLRQQLQELGVHRLAIKTDYFPGLA